MINGSMAKFMAPGRKVLSVLLAMLLVFVPLLQAEVAASSIEDIILIIWAALKSCGIQLAGTTSGVVNFIFSELQEYAETLNKTVSDIIYGLKYSVNSLGEFIINDTFVDFINDFIGFITSKFNLSDNQTKQLVDSNIHIDGMTSYALPLHIENSSTYYADWTVYLTNYDVYAIWGKASQNANTVSLWLWSYNPATVKRVQGTRNGVYADVNMDLVETADNGIYWYHDGAGFNTASYNIASYYDIYLNDDIHTALTSLPDIVPAADPVVAYTTNIIAPQYNVDYHIGDGAQINIGSDWGASIYDLFDQIRRLIGDLSNQITIYYKDLTSIEQQVPKPSDVENLPAGTIYNINGIYPDSEGNGGLRLGGIWNYVTEWVDDFSEAAPIIWYVVTNSPAQLVNLLYATVVIAVVIGFIHKARSH